MRINTEKDKRVYDLLFLFLSGKPVARKVGSSVSAEWTQDDWDALVVTAFSQGVSALLYHSCEARPDLGWVPQWVWDRLRKDYYVNFGRNMLIAQELEKFCRASDAQRFPVLLLRGVTFFQSIYPTLGVRPMIDLDFVVRRKDLALCREVLGRLGYRAFPGFPFFYEKDDIYFDVHVDSAGFWKIPRWPTGLKISDPKLWQNAVCFRGYTHVKELSLYDSLLSCCDHLQMHSFSRLIWFMDIVYLMKSEKPEFDWDGCLARAREIGLERPFCLVAEFLAAGGLAELPKNWPVVRPRLNWFEEKVRAKLLHNERDDLPGELLSWLAVPGLNNKLKILWDVLSTRTTDLEDGEGRAGRWGEKRVCRLVGRTAGKAVKALRK